MSDAAFRISDEYGSIVLSIDAEGLMIRIDDEERRCSIEIATRLEAALSCLLSFVSEDSEDIDEDG